MDVVLVVVQQQPDIAITKPICVSALQDSRDPHVRIKIMVRHRNKLTVYHFFQFILKNIQGPRACPKSTQIKSTQKQLDNGLEFDFENVFSLVLEFVFLGIINTWSRGSGKIFILFFTEMRIKQAVSNTLSRPPFTGYIVISYFSSFLGGKTSLFWWK